MMDDRIVITGVGLTSPIGDDLDTFRRNLLAGKSGVTWIEPRYMDRVPAGVCNFETNRYQKRKEARRGTRAGSISIYCAREAFVDAGLDVAALNPARTGVFIGTTEHGNVETENEIANIKEFDYDTKYWTHHHNPRTVANSPAGEVCLNMGITGPHVCLGSACAAGNYGLIHGVQQLLLGEVDVAIGGGVSESIHTFGIFAGFRSQNALAMHDDPSKASRPFDRDRNGLVVAEGGCLFVLERRTAAEARGARIHAEIAGYAVNTDATDFVLPNPERQAECMVMALERAGIAPGEVDLVSTHATATHEGDIRECEALRSVFGSGRRPFLNNTKSFIGHAMGAAGALELAGNLPSFVDGFVHPTINLDQVDPACDLPGIVARKPCQAENIACILNNSFGMLGINAVLLVRRP
ncbi:MAG: beta-ketoacyl-[acyl-carrier-protein] synthase family protein [Pirellulales bacterium]|nr:beta-ketoacyl-[acyl-carrier-protein] synthase family protein [Pirellulales bacterium]